MSKRLVVVLAAALAASACKKAAPTVSFIRSQAPTDLAALEANGCIASARQAVLALTVPTLTDPDAQARLGSYVALFDPAVDLSVGFQRDGKPSAYYGLGVVHHLKKGNLTVVLLQSFDITNPSTGAESTASFLTVSTVLKLRRDNQLELYATQSYRIDGKPSCPQTLINYSAATFTPTAAGPVHMDYAEHNAMTGNVIASFGSDVDQALLKAEATNTDSEGKAAISALVRHQFYTPTMPDATITTTWQGTVQALDPETKTTVPFNQFSETLQIHAASAASATLTVSTASAFSTFNINKTFSEEINRDLFLSSPLQGNSNDSQPKMSGFNDGDFANPNLSIAVGSGQDLTFDNLSAYFDVSSADPAALPTDQSTRSSWLRLTNHIAAATIELPALAHPFVPAAAGSPYLGRSYYIDYDDPGIQAMAASIRAALPPRPTYGDVTASVLKAVVEAVKYDSESVNQAAVTRMRASDALKSKKGVCQHFAALFVAVSRLLGLPSRVIDGFDLSKDAGKPAEAGGHAWVEALIDNSSWLPLEPQTTSLHLTTPSYLPLAVDDGYDYDPQSDRATTSDFALSQAMTGLYLVRMTGTPPPTAIAPLAPSAAATTSSAEARDDDDGGTEVAHCTGANGSGTVTQCSGFLNVDATTLGQLAVACTPDGSFNAYAGGPCNGNDFVSACAGTNLYWLQGTVVRANVYYQLGVDPADPDLTIAKQTCASSSGAWINLK